jgi:hypothetical protein
MLPQSHIKGTDVFHPMQGTLSDVLGLPTMENNGNEDRGEVGGDDPADWPPSDEENNHINFGSINMPVVATRECVSHGHPPNNTYPNSPLRCACPDSSSHALSPFLSSHCKGTSVHSLTSPVSHYVYMYSPWSLYISDHTCTTPTS